ncbi:MAG TPA: Holliday junction branch migration protein RuvA [Syntrophales bacterium]|jgi:Holliday junction DNA helicase RuvA|nr:Holliday junction branch migration protein RuvA [Syntrophobacterales bacterium]HRR41088.1 Holliday junction branch migration protein RuvA [Syntrophales bacterium]HRT27674.1 Holliday junction branch migration protein RuvA [Syntrophales bacterium]HRT70553.1 Holliday junction branch migration protein RuvA [Syntrophales bacterium]
MIASLQGTLTHKSLSGIIVEVNGIGYQVFVPLSTYYELPEVGLPVSLKIHTYVKEDALQLFGFRTEEEKDVFQLMISVTGIGPRLATNILSGISALEFVRAVCNDDVKRLVGIPGVGRKTADRMVFELKDRLSKMVPPQDAVAGEGKAVDGWMKEDALSALVNLGYRGNVAKEAVDRVVDGAPEGLTLEVTLKRALKILAKQQ